MCYRRYGGSSFLLLCTSAQILEAISRSVAVEDHEMFICVMKNTYMFCPVLIDTGNLQYLPLYTLEPKSSHYKLYEYIFLGDYCTMLSVTRYVGPNSRMTRTWLTL